MPVECKEIVSAMEKIAPTILAEEWDNSGFLIGNKNKQIEKILFALDATSEVIEEAIKVKADMIITHHPLIFKAVKSITNETLGGRIYKLIQNDICLYCAHTNFDIVFGGTNDILAQKLGLKNIDILEVEKEYQGKKYGIGRIGILEKETEFLEYIDILKNILGLKRVNVIGDLDRKIKKVALCTGSGSDYIEAAYKNNADLYISGDVRFHDGQKLQELNLCFADITHYHSENLAMPVLKEYLEKELKNNDLKVEMLLSNVNGEIFKSI